MSDLRTLLVALGTPPEGTAPLWVQFLPFALILAIFYFVILLPMRRRQKKIADFQASLKVGDRVIETERGELLWSVKQIAPNQFAQIGKVTGKVYNVPLVMGSRCTQDGKTQTSDYCHQCHSVVR